MQEKPTIIFDRSAFHGEDFERLATSNLLALTRSGRVRVHHTAILFEETLAMYRREDKRAEFCHQLPFILDICNGRWIRERTEIWQRELVESNGRKANVFVTADERANTERRLREVASGKGGFEEFWETLPKKRCEQVRQEQQLATFKEMRAVADEIRRGQKPEDKVPPSPQEFVRREMRHFGQALIRAQFGRADDPWRLAQSWKNNRRNFPFVTAFIESYVYAGYFAMIESNDRIDPNAQADIEQLTGLLKADILVSCDTRFQRRAFDALWAGRGCRMMTTAEFIEQLPQLAGP